MEKMLLPKELEKVRKEIEATLKPTIKITTKEEQTTLYQSKFSGLPYLPKTEEHPKDAAGNPMKLLAQINFEELPSNLEDLPKKGILQFFLAAEDDVMGLNFDDQTEQTNFKVVYHKELLPEGQLVTDFSYQNHSEEEYFPVTNELSLTFNLEHEAVSVADHAFENAFGNLDFEEIVKTEDNEDITLWEIYAETLTNDGHKIGGYAFFTQADPREDETYDDYDILLLQIDSEDEAGIMWGDSGVGNFFIKKEDLKNGDFSNILYNWDCC
ncbi:uncharacterized protein YwqG [Planomicrobium soli]|uniref:Uncharacterized protein YwqG n=1 Tax=Planomicrobium soli TaxID=1176648 RepID=A0A2P8H4A3_9BACL|nr:YwqG family protein [Planomicrobium soli]PSL41038.1 uncharacterized protein YwqG [Planomicrobium soli]